MLSGSRNRNMKIVFINVGIISSNYHALGVPYAVGLGKALISKGYDLTVVTSKVGKMVFQKLGLDAEFYLVDNQEEMKHPNSLYLTLIMLKRMFKAGSLLRKKEFNGDTVIFALSNLMWETFPLLLIRKKPVIRVSAFHRAPNPFKKNSVINGKKKFPGLKNILVYIQHNVALLFIKYGSDIVVSNPNIPQYLCGFGIPQERIMDMEVGVEWGIINSVTSLEWQHDACWARKYNSQKQCNELLEIWGIVHRSKSNAKLAVMEIGVVGRPLKRVTGEEKLKEEIEFTGPITEEGKYRVMKQSSIFLFPSDYEAAVPVIIIEAMACGLPVIAYDLPVYDRYFPRGIVKIPVGDKHAFASAVIDILTDDKKKRRLAGEAISLAHEYSWDKAAEHFLFKVNCLISKQSFKSRETI